MTVIQNLHKLVSPVLYRSGIYQKIWEARGREIPFTFVAFYHRVVKDGAVDSASFNIESGIPATVFEQQMRFMLRHFKPVKASQVQSPSGNALQFAITLDDGYEDNYLVAAPILKKLGIPATFYVVSDFVGTERLFWWEQVAAIMHRSNRTELQFQEVFPMPDDQDSSPVVLPLTSNRERSYAYDRLCALIRTGLHADIPRLMSRVEEYFSVPVRDEGRDYGLMDWKQLKELVKQGFEIGCHTATHCNVIGADEVMLDRELLQSIQVLESHLDCPVESFAYPYGLYEKSSTQVASVLAKTGCKAAFTIEQGMVHAESSAYELPRSRLNRPYDFACAYNVQDTLNHSHIPV